jgi:hypothetical protein
MSDQFAAWAKAVAADPAIPPDALKIANALVPHFRAHGGRPVLAASELVEAAGVFNDITSIRPLLAHGWLARTSRVGYRAVYVPTVPLAFHCTALRAQGAAAQP